MNLYPEVSFNHQKLKHTTTINRFGGLGARRLARLVYLHTRDGLFPEALRCATRRISISLKTSYEQQALFCLASDFISYLQRTKHLGTNYKTQNPRTSPALAKQP